MKRVKRKEARIREEFHKFYEYFAPYLIFFCPNCGKNFENYNLLDLHIALVHPEAKEFSVFEFNPSRRDNGVWA